MDSQELHERILTNPYLLPHFRGIFSSDQLPSLHNNNSSSTFKPALSFAIVNLCNRKIRGIASMFLCHWVVIIKISDTCIYYFCTSGTRSFRLSPSLGEKIESFLKQRRQKQKKIFQLKPKIIYNSTRLQASNSLKCGEFCLVFLALFYQSIYSASMKNNHHPFNVLTESEKRKTIAVFQKKFSRLFHSRNNKEEKEKEKDLIKNDRIVARLFNRLYKTNSNK